MSPARSALGPGRRVPAVLAALALAAPVVAEGLLEVGLEGGGEFRMNDGEALEGLLRRSLDRRFPEGFGRARASLAVRPSSRDGELSLTLTRPSGYDGVREATARIRVESYREALDQGTARNVKLDLEGFEVALDPEVVCRALGIPDRRLVLARLRPGETFGLEEGTPAERLAFGRAAQEAGFPPASEADETRVRNGTGSALWLVTGVLAPPIGSPGKVVAEPRVIAGGGLGLRLLLVFAGGRRRPEREALALERAVQDRVEAWWRDQERKLDVTGFLTAGRIAPDGELFLGGVGFLAFHHEQGILREEERKRTFRPTLLVGPDR